MIDYWRSKPPPGEESNFDVYRIFPCDVQDACLGGSNYDALCSDERDQQSPVCGLCKDGYVSYHSNCITCNTFITTSSLVWLFVLATAFAVSSCMVFVYFYMARLERALDSNTETVFSYFIKTGKLTMSFLQVVSGFFVLCCLTIALCLFCFCMCVWFFKQLD